MDWLLSLGEEREVDGRRRLRWYNAWTTKQRPYRECHSGDGAFIVNRTHYLARGEFSLVEKFQYVGEAQFVDHLKRSGWGEPRTAHPYFERLPPQGYCLAYHLDIRRLPRPKPRPPDFRMPQLGWAALDDYPDELVGWLGAERAGRLKSKVR